MDVTLEELKKVIAGDDGKMVEVKESTGQYRDAYEMIAEGGMV